MAGFEFNSDEQGRALVNVGNTLVDLANIVFRVHDQTGNVVLTTANITEHTNLYFSNTRARNAFTAGSGITIAANGLISANVGSLDLGNANIVIMAGVDSVNGANGNVILTTSNIAEGANLYFTNSRARTAISITGSGTYNNTTGVITITAGSGDVVSVNGANGNVVLTTANLAESGNLYFTNDRVWSNVVASITTSYVPEGANLYFTNARVSAYLSNISGNLIPDSDNVYDLGSASNRWRDLYLTGNSLYLGNITIKDSGSGIRFLSSSTGTSLPIEANTSSLVESSNNLFFTNARARAALTVTGNGTYNNTTGVITVTGLNIAGSNGQIQYNSAGNLAASANLVWDNANGRLGIGNVSIPVSYPLTIIGNNPRATVKGTGAGLNVGYRLEATDSGSTSRSAGYYFVPVTGSNQSYLGLSADDSSYQLVARADGNVGVGTTNPSQRLEIGTSTANSSVLVSSTASTSQEFLTFQDNGLNGHATVLRMVDANGTNAYGGLTMYTYRRSDAASLRIHSYNLIANNAASANSEAILDFWARAYSDNFTTLTTGLHSNLKAFRFVTQSSTELVTILANGNMGIGVASPGQRLEVAGTGLATTDWRAPIFYDSDDTSYYVNPAGTSILNNARANNFHDSTGTYNVNLGSPSEGRGLVAGYSGGWYAGIGYNVRHSGSTGVMYAPSADTALYLNFGNTNRFNFWFNNSGAAGRSISWTELGFLDNSGIMQVTGSHRAPIFYDSNDTGYYLNPNSGSQLSAVYANNWFRPQGDTGLYFESKGYGLWSAGSAGASYGNASTYGAGVNSWQGWNITNDFTWMGRDNSDCGLYDSSSGHWIIYSLYNTSYMGLNSSTTSASYSVYLSGSLYTTSTITEASDRRKKKDIVTIDSALAKVNQLRGVYYSKIDNPVKNLQDKREMGVIAQEVDLVTPEVVTYASDTDEYGVAYGNFAGLFIEAIKELTTKVNSLAEELKVLKDKYNDN
jgi:hypothetical protein